MNPRHEPSQSRHCSCSIVRDSCSPCFITSYPPSSSPETRTPPQDASPRWNACTPPYSIHSPQMDLDRTFHLAPSSVTDAAGRPGSGRPPRCDHGVCPSGRSYTTKLIDEQWLVGCSYYPEVDISARKDLPDADFLRGMYCPQTTESAVLTPSNAVVSQIMDHRPHSAPPYSPPHGDMGETAHAT